MRRYDRTNYDLTKESSRKTRGLIESNDRNTSV